MRVTFFATVASSLAIHAGAALALSNVSPNFGPRPSTVVRMEIKNRAAPPEPMPIAIPETDRPPPPKKQAAKKLLVHRADDRDRAPPKETPKKVDVKPVFGLNLASDTVAESTVGVIEGNTMAADPNAPRPEKIEPLPKGDAAMGASASNVASDDDRSRAIRSLPQIDARACGKLISYPQEAEALGIEGDVTLRVSLDAKGRAHRVTVIRGLGHGLDQVAQRALLELCRFTPAIATDGKPVAYVIPEYVFHFEIPR